MVTTVQRWSGRETRALREAMRMSVREFAEQLGISHRNVSKWEAGGADVVPRPGTQEILDDALANAAREVQIRFELSLGLARAESARAGADRGRISQIRQTAPPAERALFGVGPVTVAVPLREVPGRALPVISSEDSRAAERLTRLLTDLAFQVHQFRIPPGGRWQPTGETVAVCGPKSSVVTAEAIRSDPFLTFEPDAAGRWAIRERDGSRVYTSAMDEGDGVWTDIAYVGRVAWGKRELLVIAGVHALGSVGAVEHLSRELPEVYAAVGMRRFSMVVRSQHEGERVVGSELACPPRAHV